MGTCFGIGGIKIGRQSLLLLGQGVIEIHLLDNNKQFSITQRPVALCSANLVPQIKTSRILGLLFHRKPPRLPCFKHLIHLYFTAFTFSSHGGLMVSVLGQIACWIIVDSDDCWDWSFLDQRHQFDLFKCSNPVYTNDNTSKNTYWHKTFW